MIRTAMLAATALFLAPFPATAQSLSQDELQARYDRALAAGYQALFLCSATANAERNGAARREAHIAEWELTGIQQPLDEIVGDLPYQVARYPDNGQPFAGQLSHVAVGWADDMEPRIAYTTYNGCSLLPMGGDLPDRRQIPRPVGDLTDGWQVDADVLGQGIALAAFGDRYGEDARTSAIVIVQDGAIVREDYAPGFGPDIPQRTWSVAKSIAATLVGAAVQRGDVAVTDSTGLGVGEGDPRNAITIDHALRMATGRYTDTPGNRTDPQYFGGATVDERATDWPLVHPPGTVWRYANNDTLVAVRAVRDGFESFAPSGFFASVGMDHTVAETDWQGNFILSSQVWSTARDLARLGQLHLDDGVLPDGTRILPEDWTDYVSAPSGPQPEGEWGYGAGWWIMSGFDGIPDDAFAARGNRGQYVVVIPSEGVVIVRRGEDPAGGSGFDIAAFTRDVLRALD
ncbi:serine hydrolase domain-containing protein [Aurantiacibacter poecillastricola]|uniref:serine hydrolase domain-containing protein n=1 Tax=Aurantiacibacter poecillastricola TaxID=3064385 RepID=UPI0027402AFE|nr:serine hydrolase [Aurantiacibacter sp. 219JJ12-13]MDP5261631.1 serine hydrolase [Aurantiacibacter sp. 219JJ12-13]